MGYELFKQYSEPYAKLVVAIKDEIPTIQRVDFKTEICSFVKNMLIKDYKKRLEIFNNTNKKIIFEQSKDTFDNILAEIKNKKQDTISSIEELHRIKEEENLKRTKKVELLNKTKNIIMNVFEELSLSSMFSAYKIILDLNNELIIKITGGWENGFCCPVYISYDFNLQEDYIFKLINKGIVKGSDYPNNKISNYIYDRIKLIHEDFDKTQGHNEIFVGVYDEKAIIENVKLNLVKLIKESIEYMKTWVIEDIEWEKQIVRKPGVNMRIGSVRSDKILII